MIDGHAEKGEDQQHVVEAGVGGHVPRPDAEVGTGDRNARGRGAEHERRRVEHLLQQDPEPEGGQGEEDPRQSDGGDGHDRPDRGGDERRQNEGDQPRQVVAVGEVTERRSPDRGEGQVAQRDLPRAPDEQSERQEEDHVDEGVRPDGQVGADKVRHEGEQPGPPRRRTPAGPSSVRTTTSGRAGCGRRGVGPAGPWG